MDKIIDKSFGELTFQSTWEREIDVIFFGKKDTVLLYAEGNDEKETILDEQRKSFDIFSADQAAVLKQVEDAIYSHYSEINGDLRAQFGASADEFAPVIDKPSDLLELIELKIVIFPMVLEPGESAIGFIFDCKWDQEHGLGIKITDGEIEIGEADLLT